MTATDLPFCGNNACQNRCTCVAFHVVGIGDTAHIEDRPGGRRLHSSTRGTTRCGVAFVPSPGTGVSRNEKVWRKCKETCTACWRSELSFLKGAV